MYREEIKFYIEEEYEGENNLVTRYKVRLSDGKNEDIKICSSDSFEELLDNLKYYI